MATYKCAFTGQQLDAFINSAQSTFLTRNEASSTYLSQSNASSNYLSKSEATSTYLSKTAASNTYTTKADTNSLSMAPGTTYTELTSLVTSQPSDWATCLSSWVAPSNGYLVIYFSSSSTTNAMYIRCDQNVAHSVRTNGNGSRDNCLMLPVYKGLSYTAGSVKCYPSWIRFIPAVTV